MTMLNTWLQRLAKLLGRGSSSAPRFAPSAASAPKALDVDDLDAVVTRLEVGDAAGAIQILEGLSGRTELVRYYLVLAYCSAQRLDNVKSVLAELPAGRLAAPRRYRIAVALECARLYDLALPLLEGLAGERATFPDVGERTERVRKIVADGGQQAFEAQLISMLDGRYTGAKVLASGGMGVVFTAQDREIGKTVAIKMLSPFLRADAENTARFMREARTLLALNHPNLVRTYTVHEKPLAHYAMELLSGATLADLIAKGPLPLADVRHISEQILAALAFCHERELIHRDIKPANVLVPSTGPLKLIDFGLVKAATSTGLTVVGTMLGTPPYMPPEQLRALPVDHTADIYSFGVVFYEMVTGRLPFLPGEEMALKIILGEYPKPSSLRAGLPDKLDSFVARTMHKDKAKRPQLSAEVALELMDLI